MKQFFQEAARGLALHYFSASKQRPEADPAKNIRKDLLGKECNHGKQQSGAVVVVVAAAAAAADVVFVVKQERLS